MPHAQIAERASLTYRPDIDGLRAVAVVPVVFYHFAVPGFGGGFVGVDIFFVISGYLITALIRSEMRSGEFSILKFYERRARRILPALFAMMAVSALAALWLLFPGDLVRFAESMGATALFGSNFDFWLRAGYFDAAAGTKPLLHTWSLAVEEQFYLVFPLLLLLLRARGRGLMLGLAAALAVPSFAASVWAVRVAPGAAFYLAPFRTWELMLGAVLALGGFPQVEGRLRDLLSAAGLALIAFAVFTYTSATPFPGENALPPCLGTALLIYANRSGGGWIARALGRRPVVFVGLVSYSFYLWHWPVYVFAKYASADGLGLGVRAGLIVLSFVLAVLSWRYVERPFRAGRHLFTSPVLFRLAGAAVAASLVFAGSVALASGLPGRFAPDIRRILAEADDIDPRRHGCFNLRPENIAQACTIGDPHAEPSFLLWGDSHADAILPAVARAARAGKRAGIFIGYGRCPPMPGIKLADENSDLCARLGALALARALRSDISEVILDARWAYYSEGHGYGPDADESARLIDLASSAPGDQHAIFARALERVVTTLVHAGKKVVLVTSVPEVQASVPEAMAHIALYGERRDIDPSLSAYRTRQQFVTRTMDSLKGLRGVSIVDPAALLCGTGECRVEAKERPLYVDNQHLSVFGAGLLTSLFAGRF